MSQYRPSADELLRVIQTFLGDSASALSGVHRYHAQVAAYAAGIVERELLCGSAADAAAQARLTELLGQPAALRELESQLAAAIRRGDCDDRWDATLAVLVANLRDQVAIVRPAHLAPEHRERSAQE